MRHQKKRLQLNRSTSFRRATIFGLVKNLLIYQSIKTTKTKALAAQPLIEKLISKAKKNTLAAKRRAYRILGSHRLVSLLFKDIATRFNNRVGGYTRILKLGRRRGDNAQLVILELTEIVKIKKPSKPKKEETLKEEDQKKAEPTKEKPAEEKKPKAQVEVKEKPPITKKPPKFSGGLRKIFKKERDSL